MVSIKRAEARQEDAFLRRRCHEWVATAFHGPPPAPGAIVEHLNDVPTDNREENLCWSGHAANRARRTANGKVAVPTGKLRKVAISLRVIRALQERTRLKGRALTAHIEAMIVRQLEGKSGA